ncbi:T9SS type A sorting domain-containing protein [bacterium]|nr:T9SS type A sorting domain-containing protein [bacterium]MBU1984272.1 T9SS type A sorting domain-containing protein [bacterium]
MNRFQRVFLLCLILGVLVGTGWALNYVWLTDEEITLYGDRIKFRHGDTLWGPVHSNSQIAIIQDPVFYDRVSTTESDFWHGSGYNPQFLGPPPMFNAPPVPLPSTAHTLRAGAARQGHFYGEPGMHYYARFDGAVCKMWRWRRGTIMDSSDYWVVYMTNNTCIFVDAPLRVHGRVQGQVTIGSSHVIEIENDIRYVDAHPYTGITPASSLNMLGLVSEGDIKIRNTPANGRENSGGRGWDQTNPDSTDVVITAALYATRSFTFENQNDPDSGYVCDCTPDNRGTIYLFGSLVQTRRGYVYRSNNTSTGYRLNLRYDSRFLRRLTPCIIEGASRPDASTDSLDFGEVAVGTTAWDTARVYTLYNGHLGAVYANHPFRGERVMPFQGSSFIVPTRFTPPGVGLFTGILYVSAGMEHFQIVLRGRGIPPEGPAPLTVNISPNPFNLTTTIRYTLPEPEAVRITLFDILGREAKRLELGAQETGEHSISLNAVELASGVYFLRLSAGTNSVMHKLLIVK